MAPPRDGEPGAVAAAAAASKPPELQGTTGATRDNMVQSLLEAGLTTVPDAFLLKSVIRNHPCVDGELRKQAAVAAAEPHEQLASLSVQQKEGIPVVDLAGWFSGDQELKDKVRQEIHRASQDWGFFQVINHGVEQSVMDGALAAASGFFQLPFSDKQQYAIKPGSYVGYGRLYEYADKVKNWNDVMVHTLAPKASQNQDTQWPHQPSTYRASMDAYQQQLQQLASALYAALSLSLGLPATHLAEAVRATEEHAAALRINLYPPCPDPARVLGFAPHADGTIITILHQNDVPGLQVRRGDGGDGDDDEAEWVLVEPLPGALLVNVGDTLEVLTNGAYKSIEHRALVNRTRERLSLAAFFIAPWDLVMAPLPALLDDANPPRYGSIPYSDFLKQYFSKGPQGKTLVQALRL